MSNIDIKELKIKLRKTLDDFRNEIINNTTVTDMFDKIPEYKLCEMFVVQFDGGYIKLPDAILDVLYLSDKPLKFIVSNASKYLNYSYCIDDVVDSIVDMNNRVLVNDVKYQYELNVRKVFINYDYVNVIFRSTSFIDCKFDNCTFKNCKFIDCVFKYTDLPSSLLARSNNNLIKDCITI